MFGTFKFFLLRKFIHRDEEKSDDPLVAEQRTIVFKKTQQENINDSAFSSDDDESKFMKLLESKRAKPTSGLKLAMENLRKSTEDSKRTRERIAKRVTEKTKTVETARINLETNQKKLKSLLEQSKTQTSSNAANSSENNVNSTLSVLQQQFELMNLNQKTMEDKITLESLEGMEDVIRKISHQINNALDFMQNAPLVIQAHDVLTLIKETSSGMNIPYGVDLELPTNTDTVHCDSEKLKSVFRNILANAIDAMDESGKIIVKITDEVYHCVVTIENSGPQIPEKNMQDIFEPLFTTKKNGSGLGLARCKEIIQRHGGKISVHNNPTRFVIQLVRKQ